MYATYFFAFCGISMIASSYFYIENHIAIPNIGLGAIGVAVVSAYFAGLKVNNSKYDWIAYLSLIAIFICYLTSVLINNDDNNLVILRYRGYIVGCVFCLMFLPILNRIFYKYIIFAFVLNLVVICILCINNYYFIALREGFQSKFLIIEYFYYYIIPFHVWHHSLSFFLLVGVIFLLYLLTTKVYYLNIYEKIVAYFSIFLFVITMHIIVSRASLAMLYAIFLYNIIKHYYDIKGVVVGIFILSFVCLLYFQLGSFKNKVDNSIRDFTHLFEGELSTSDYRLYSYKISFEIIESHFWKGVALSQTTKYYNDVVREKYPTISLIRPHNEFLYNAVTMGVPIALLFMLAMYVPFLLFKRNKLIVGFFISLSLYMLIDSPMNIREFYYFYCFIVPFIIHIKKLDDWNLQSKS